MIMLSLITTSFAVATLFSISIEAAPSQDKVTSLPGFEPFPENFDVYSGFLNVTFPKPVGDYDAVVIHYQFHTSRGDPSTDPVVAWVRSYLLFLSFSHTHTHTNKQSTLEDLEEVVFTSNMLREAIFKSVWIMTEKFKPV